MEIANLITQYIESATNSFKWITEYLKCVIIYIDLRRKSKSKFSRNITTTASRLRLVQSKGSYW